MHSINLVVYEAATCGYKYPSVIFHAKKGGYKVAEYLESDTNTCGEILLSVRKHNLSAPIWKHSLSISDKLWFK
jgi:hypothetical protein